MSKRQSEYLSYLLRLWRVSGSATPDPDRKGMDWRASLQDTLTDERVSFANLEDLVAFLRRRTDTAADVGMGTTESET